MKLAIFTLALASLTVASPVEAEKRAAPKTNDLAERDAEKRYDGWVYGTGGPWNACNFRDRSYDHHRCSIDCWNRGFNYYDPTVIPSCCCWGYR
ncbi:unnamed protein product [Cutaneotrichosporon oleaginosum]